jgi:hypothetical protein
LQQTTHRLINCQPIFAPLKIKVKKINNWERLPFAMIYAPFIFVWLYYFIRSRHFWFFSNVNPTMHFSGFEGETKEEISRQLPAENSPVTIYIQPSESFDCVLKKMCHAGLRFPVAVKPDIGTKGLLFRKIVDEKQLADYHALLPFTYLIQDMITMPLELSIFYVRYPGTKKGIITGLIAKEYLHVKGDGRSTLKQLIERHPKAFMMAYEQKQKHKAILNDVIPQNGAFYLNELGNHNRGARFINLKHEIDGRLSCVIDKLNLCSRHFYYGRYDIKTTSLEDLKQGKNISILEYNGTGSEPNHIYDIGLSYGQALHILAQHWKYMYEIGKINYNTGIAYIPFWKGVKMVRASKKNTRLMTRLDLQCKI